MTHTKGFLVVDMPMIVVGAVMILLAAFCAPMASAQNPINQYIIGYYVRGATAPITSTAIPVTPTLCGQPKVTVLNTIDPTRVVWEDPTNPLQDCIFIDPVLVGTPLGYGQLDGRMVACNGTPLGTNCSVPSNTAEFSRSDPRAPGVPTGLRIVRD